MNGKGVVGKSSLCYLFYLAIREVGKSVFREGTRSSEESGDVCRKRDK